MPAIPSGAYVGFHYSCTDHQLSFGSVFESKLEIRWKAIAKFTETDPGVEFFADTDLRFAGIRVRAGESETTREVRDGLSEWFDLSEFKRAKKEKHPGCQRRNLSRDLLSSSDARPTIGVQVNELRSISQVERFGSRC